MNELAVIDQAEIETALAKVEWFTLLLNAPTIHENAQAKKDASLELSKIAKLLDSKRADAVKPALEEQRRINGIFKPVMEKLDDLSKKLILQVSDFVRAEEKKEREIAAIAARAEAERLLAGEVTKPVVQAPPPVQTPTVSETKVWVYDIVNPNEVPREYLEVDPLKVTTAIKAGKRQIPGLRIYQKTIVGRR